MGKVKPSTSASDKVRKRAASFFSFFAEGPLHLRLRTSNGVSRKKKPKGIHATSQNWTGASGGFHRRILVLAPNEGGGKTPSKKYWGRRRTGELLGVARCAGRIRGEALSGEGEKKGHLQKERKNFMQGSWKCSKGGGLNRSHAKGRGTQNKEGLEVITLKKGIRIDRGIVT